MIYKLVDTTSFYKEDEPVARVVVPGHFESGLTKQAAHSAIENYVNSMLEPKGGKSYLHINAMGAGEYYGSNKNGDYFPEEQLIRFHKSFEEFGYVYRHHVNKDPAKSMGKVIFAVYNHDMHRVELIAEIDNKLGEDILSRIEAGDFPFTSMACKTPFDVCSLCGNRAHTRNEYCEHLSGQLNKLLPDGRKIMAINSAPLKFFDISIVIRPADITSSVLRKVASEEEFTVGSAEVAESEGINASFEKQAATIKQAALNKLADLIKEIDDGLVIDASDSLNKILAKAGDPGVEYTHRLLSLGTFNQVMNALAEENVSPSIGFIAQLIHQHSNPGSKEDVASSINAAVPSVSIADIPARSMELIPDVYSDPAPTALKRLVAELVPGSSLSPEYVEKRAFYWEKVHEKAAPFMPQLESIPVPNRNNTNTEYLIALIGAALVGKFILNTLSKQKNQLKLVYGNQQVKTASQLSAANVLLDSSAVAELHRFKK
jgi:hypothetical protein